MTADAVQALMASRPTLVGTAAGPVTCADIGTGPVVLAVHGGMGGWDQGLLLAAALLPDRAGLRVLAPSRPGYPGTPLGLGRTPEAQADLHAALLDRLGVAEAVVAAVSAGGPSSLQFALRHPARCRGLVLVSAASGRLDVPPQAAARLPMLRRMARYPWLATVMRMAAALGRRGGARRSIPDRALRERTLRHPEAGPMLRALQASVMRRLGDRLPGTLNDIDLLSALAPLPLGQIRTPVLVVHGTADRVVPFAHAERVVREVPGAIQLALDGGHVSLFTHLDTLRAGVADFMSRLPASAAVR